MKKGDLVVMAVLLILLFSPLDILSGNPIDDIGYILGIIAQGKKMLEP